MGRVGNAVDWMEEGSGVGLRALTVYPERLDSEVRLRAETEAAPLLEEEEEPPTRRFQRASASEPCPAIEPLGARGIARLSALADWIGREEPSGPVVALVRAFLGDVHEVGAATDALVAAARSAPDLPELGAAVQSLALAIALWRNNLVEHVDDLALSDHRSFSGWSSLPEYSCAFTLAIVRPALAEARAWAQSSRKREASDFCALVGAVNAAVERVNATLRGPIAGARGARAERPEDVRLESSLLVTAW
jgi:hypothetical protein